jgi:hypothetical protein
MSTELTSISLETNRINEKKELLQSFSAVDVQVDYFWDSYGSYVNWNNHTIAPKTWSDANVQIVLYSFTTVFPSTGNSYDFETNQLVINDKVVSGDLIDCTVKLDPANNKTCLYCRVAVGWG